MQLVTNDAADYLKVPHLKEVVFRAIEADCAREYQDVPSRIKPEAEIRKDIVIHTLAVLEGYEDSQVVMLKAWLKHFTGEKL